MSAKRFAAPKGMRDIMPPDTEAFRKVESIFVDTARLFGYSEIRTPHLESTDLFVRTVGEATDIVEKEMYSLETKGGDRLALRPENTAGVVRSYLENGLHKRAPLQRLFYFGEMFRHESAQKKRYREFTQSGVELFGSRSPQADAEVIALALEVFDALGIGDVNLQLSTLGCSKCRPAYRQALLEYFTAREDKLCGDCKRRLTKNVCRLLDCKEDSCKELAIEAPRIELDDECREHYSGVKAILDSASMRYVENPFLVRGLDYYSRTVFEVFPASGTGRQDALCGGGRYDSLGELLGGKTVPAVGFAMGVDRIVLELKEKGAFASGMSPEVFIVSEDDAAGEGNVSAHGLAMDLRRAGVSVISDLLGKRFPDKQLKDASKSGARIAVIVGGEELSAGKAGIKNLVSGEQEAVSIDDLVGEVTGRLSSMQKESDS